MISVCHLFKIVLFYKVNFLNSVYFTVNGIIAIISNILATDTITIANTIILINI